MTIYYSKGNFPLYKQAYCIFKKKNVVEIDICTFTKFSLFATEYMLGLSRSLPLATFA